MISRFTLLFLFLVALFGTDLQAQYIYMFAGTGFGYSTGTGGYSGDGGQARQAELNAPAGVCYDGAGNVYIADRNNNVVRKVNTAGVITTFAGTGTAGNSGNNGPATAARLNKPCAIATDKVGNVYIADYGNNMIRMVNTSGIISAYAGTGTSGYTGDFGPASAARLSGPEGLAMDTLGNLYIADANNNAIRMISGGVIMTIAGNGTGGHGGDGGPAMSATLNGPAGVALDPYGQIYIADYFNNAVRKIDASGTITTIAGTGTAGFAGDNGAATAAQLHFPSGIAVFGFNAIYISDEGNNAVRMINGSGVITTVAGNFTNGYAGDAGLAVNAELASPKGIAVDALNRLYIADYDNNVIRIVRSFTAVRDVPGNNANLKVYPNPANDVINIELPVSCTKATVMITDVVGKVVKQTTVAGNSQKFEISVNDIGPGNYFLKVASGDYTWREKISVW